MNYRSRFATNDSPICEIKRTNDFQTEYYDVRLFENKHPELVSLDLHSPVFILKKLPKLLTDAWAQGVIDNMDGPSDPKGPPPE